MADPLSIATSITGVLSLGIQVIQSLVEYYTAYRDQDAYIAKTTQKLENLLVVFQSLSRALEARKFREDENSLINQITDSIGSCKIVINELQDEARKIRVTPENNVIDRVTTAGRRVAHPFRKSTLKKLDEDVTEIHQNISLAQEVLQLVDGGYIRNDVEEVKALVSRMRSTQIYQGIASWLKAPDATINYIEAFSKRNPGSGLWLVKGPEFRTWLETKSSFIWIQGFAGCGKSVLCSTVIEHTFWYKGVNPNIGIAFFYFTFTDESKQNLSSMLCAFLHQLSNQLFDGDTYLQRLKKSCTGGLPHNEALIATLKEILQQFQDVYLIVDALDESPLDKSRGSVLKILQDIQNWPACCLHVLVTSHNLPDIRTAIQHLGSEISMKNEEVDKDISNFIARGLKEDELLQKWSDYHDRIREALTAGAKGVFRWVECQFKSLAKTPRSKAALEKRLSSLPQSLDETYERMLLNIDSDCKEDAKRIFTLLCFAPRPLTVDEVLHGITVQLGENPRVDLDFRMQDEHDILQICPGFVDIFYDSEESIPKLRIAHFSVQEYLESDRIYQQQAAEYGSDKATAHAEIAQVCLTYLLDPMLSITDLTVSILVERPLLKYAANYWNHHYSGTRNVHLNVETMIENLFYNQPNNFQNWMRIYGEERPYDPNITVSSLTIPSPIYMASLFGYITIVQFLLDRGADVNSQGGRFDTPLKAASTNGHTDVVRLLLAKGAEINATFSAHDNAQWLVMFALGLKYKWQVNRLLEFSGIDINAKEQDRSMIPLKTRNEKENAKATFYIEVNPAGKNEATALMIATIRENEAIVRLLLQQSDIEVNIKDENGQTALMAAVLCANEAIVRLLLERSDTEVNAKNVNGQTALMFAVLRQDAALVRLLLERSDIDVDAKDDKHGDTALTLAAIAMDISIVNLLLKRSDIGFDAKDKRTILLFRAGGIEFPK